MVRDEIGGGVSTGGVETGLGGGGGGDGERTGCTGGGSKSETGMLEISPALPSIKGDSAEGGDGGSIKTPFRRGEPVRNGEALLSGVTGSIALVDVGGV